MEIYFKDQIEWCPEIEGFVFYALRLTNGEIYKGYTAHFRNRMLSHFNGGGCQTTRFKKPIYILHHEVFQTKQEALERERYYKKSTGGYKLRYSAMSFKGFKPKELQ